MRIVCRYFLLFLEFYIKNTFAKMYSLSVDDDSNPDNT